MRFDVITVFPEMISAALDHSIVKRAIARGLISVNVVNLRDFTTDRHKTTDDIPYGGGGGMVMKVEPIARALGSLDAAATSGHAGTVHRKGVAAPAAPRVILTDPRGRAFTQGLAREWAGEPRLIVICGHYEGVDERVRRHLVTDQVSIGDYILTGGELAALVIIDAVTRLQPGALGSPDSARLDTFESNLLEYPQYTRPEEFRGWQVPPVLLGGHHARIERWRRWWQLRATLDCRPDLLNESDLTEDDRRLARSAEPGAEPVAGTNDVEPSRSSGRSGGGTDTDATADNS